MRFSIEFHFEPTRLLEYYLQSETKTTFAIGEACVANLRMTVFISDGLSAQKAANSPLLAKLISISFPFHL